jgi:RNA polymerase sigma factor (sigma-70 family)
MSYARNIARKVHQSLRGFIELEELECESMLALVKLTKRWDPNQSSLKTFITQRIYFALYDWVRDQSFLSRLEVSRIKRGEREPVRFMSLYANQESESSLEDDLAAPDYSWRAEIRDHALTLMGRLQKIDREILHCYFFQAMTMAQVAKRIGMSEPRVSQRIAAAIEKMRKEELRLR